jgi:hypothetical protein
LILAAKTAIGEERKDSVRVEFEVSRVTRLLQPHRPAKAKKKRKKANDETAKDGIPTVRLEGDQPMKKKRCRLRKGDSAKGPRLLPENKSRLAVNQTAEKEAKTTM